MKALPILAKPSFKPAPSMPTKTPNEKYQGMPALILIAIFLAGMIFSTVRGYWMDSWLNQDGTRLTATITAKQSHGVFEYDYVVADTHYQGHSQIGPNWDRGIQVGSEVHIYASLSHPWFSLPQIPTLSPWRALVVMAVSLYLEFLVLRSLVRMHRPNTAPPKPT